MKKSRLSSMSGAPRRISHGGGGEVRASNGTRRSSKERTRSVGFGSQSQTGRGSTSSSSGTNRFSSMATAAKSKGAAGTSRISGIGVRGRSDILKDPRPLSDKKYLHGMIRRLLEFLVTNNYPNATSEKLLAAPSSKEFFRMFEFIYRQLCPNYSMAAKMEEEVPKLLKLLGYPFTISKMNLFSVGSPHVWPNLCGALMWMIDLIKSANNMINTVGIDAVIFHNPEDDDELQEEKLFFDFAEKSYKVFMEGYDNFEDINQELETLLSYKYKGGDLEQITDENNKLVAEIEQLKEKEECLSKLQEKVNQEEQDLLQLEKHTNKLKKYRLSLVHTLETHTNECAALQSELQHEKRQLEKVQKIYEQQDMTPAFVNRMKKEQNQLKKQVEDLEGQLAAIDEISNKVYIEAAKIAEKTTAEVRLYNCVATDLKIIPSCAENANGQDFSLPEDNNSNANIPETYEHFIKPKLMQMKKQFTEEIRQKSKQKYQQQTCQIEQLQEKINDTKQVLAGKKKELNRLEADIEYLKQSSQKENRSNASEKSHLEELRTDFETKIKIAEESRDSCQAEFSTAQKDLQAKKSNFERKLHDMEKEKQQVLQEKEKHTNRLKAQLTEYIKHLRKVDAEMDHRLDNLQKESEGRQKWIDDKHKQIATMRTEMD